MMRTTLSFHRGRKKRRKVGWCHFPFRPRIYWRHEKIRKKTKRPHETKNSLPSRAVRAPKSTDRLLLLHARRRKCCRCRMRLPEGNTTRASLTAECERGPQHENHGVYYATRIFQSNPPFNSHLRRQAKALLFSQSSMLAGIPANYYAKGAVFD